MKLSNQLFSSITSLRNHFDFNEVWSKLDSFIRNASFNKILYNGDTSNEDKEYYVVLSNSGNYTFNKHGVINKAGNIIIQSDKNEVKLLDSLETQDKVQLIALSRLCRFSISEDIINAVSYKVPFNEDVIVLNYGQSLKLFNIASLNIDKSLVSKKIIVDSSSSKSSVIGNITLKPGEGTYGVFCGDRLVSVCPVEISNTDFCLKSQLLPDNSIEVKAINLRTGTICRSYKNCKFFTVLGSNNFLVINNFRVECYNNQHLQHVIDKSISILDDALYLDVDSKCHTITITLSNKSKKHINY